VKRSEALLLMQRHYGIRHCMVEGKYITVKQFCDEMLSLLESSGVGLVREVVSKTTIEQLEKVYGWQKESE
jgi:hypothetical protein